MYIFQGRNVTLGNIIKNQPSIIYSNISWDENDILKDIQNQGCHYQCIDLDNDNANYVTYIVLAFSIPKTITDKDNEESMLEGIKAGPNYEVILKTLKELNQKFKYKQCGEDVIEYERFDTIIIYLQVDDLSVSP